MTATVASKYGDELAAGRWELSHLGAGQGIQPIACNAQLNALSPAGGLYNCQSDLHGVGIILKGCASPLAVVQLVIGAQRLLPACTKLIGRTSLLHRIS